MPTLYTGTLAGIEIKDGEPVNADGATQRQVDAIAGYIRRHGLRVDDEGRLVVPDPGDPSATSHPTHAHVGTRLADASASTPEPLGDSEGGRAEAPPVANDQSAPERPSDKDVKDVWIDHARTLGIDTKGLTKPQLIEAVDNR